MASRDFTISECKCGFTIEPHTLKARQWLKHSVGNETARMVLVLEPSKVVDMAETLRKIGFRVND